MRMALRCVSSPLMENKKAERLRIGFLGLGGVGGYFGAKLSRAVNQSGSLTGSQAEIVFLAREKTAKAIRANGIRLITPTEEFTARPHAVLTPDDELTPLDVLICSVKSYDLEQSLESFRGCISENTALLPLLNGVDAEERIRALFPHNDVWSGCVYIVSRLSAPGVITETGNIHHLHFGAEHDRHGNLPLLFSLMKSAHDGVTLHPHADIRNVVWEKFVFISALASLTSYLDVCLGKILGHSGNCALLTNLLNEISAVAQAEKIVLREDIVSVSLEKMRKLPYETTSSMHSDFQKGNLTEYLSLTGHVTQLARKHGIAVPHYDRILDGLRERTRLTHG